MSKIAKFPKFDFATLSSEFYINFSIVLPDLFRDRKD